MYHNSIAFTNAPIPSWLTYDESQIQKYRSPEQVELMFQSFKGIDITDDYIHEINQSLGQINEFIQSVVIRDQVDMTFKHVDQIVAISLTGPRTGDRYTIPFIILDDIVVRPCANKLGFSRIFLWQIIKSCSVFGCDLQIRRVTDTVKTIIAAVQSLGFGGTRVFRGIRKGNNPTYIALLHSDMMNAHAYNLSVENMIQENDYNPNIMTVNEAAIPSAQQLNTQEYVDIRYKNALFRVGEGGALASMDQPNLSSDIDMISDKMKSLNKRSMSGDSDDNDDRSRTRRGAF